MTYIVSITSQGQMTIPAEIRLALGLQKASKAIVSTVGGKMVVEPEPDIMDLYGAFASKNRKRVSRAAERRAFEDALAKGEA
jgi:AbrB family looped-hinge helix DNA binding protein